MFIKGVRVLCVKGARAQNNMSLKLASRNSYIEVLDVLKNEFGLTAIDARFGRSDRELIQYFEEKIQLRHKEVVDFYKNEWGINPS